MHPCLLESGALVPPVGGELEQLWILGAANRQVDYLKTCSPEYTVVLGAPTLPWANMTKHDKI